MINAERPVIAIRIYHFVIAVWKAKEAESPIVKTLNKIPIPSFLIALMLGFVVQAQGVSPPPDGGYPGGNTAEGQNALSSLTTGGFNTAAGYFSLSSNSTGSFNTAVGAGALDLNTSGNNTATGAAALLSNTFGFNNTADGAFALLFNTTGTDNIALGHGAGTNVSTATNVIAIGSAGANVDDSTWILNIYGTATASGVTLPVIVSDGGQLGTASSSRRFKTDIKPMDKASESILALKPVSFRYKIHKDMTPQFGLIAEQVAEINPNLVIYDADGKPYTVRYDAVNAMLLNEFLRSTAKLRS